MCPGQFRTTPRKSHKQSDFFPSTAARAMLFFSFLISALEQEYNGIYYLHHMSQIGCDGSDTLLKTLDVSIWDIKNSYSNCRHFRHFRFCSIFTLFPIQLGPRLIFRKPNCFIRVSIKVRSIKIIFQILLFSYIYYELFLVRRGNGSKNWCL